jgi:histidyl-tRNA synthetase
VKIQSPKGTRDFYPELQALQNHLFTCWQDTCLKYGYEEYEGPMFEHLELYTGKSGDEIISQLYHFQDKGQRDIALRPEMTPTLARLINQKGPALKKPVKWFSIPRLFRYERAQKGRLREFYQLNMDIIGSESTQCELDLILAIAALLKKLGLKQEDFSISISNRRLLAAILEQRSVTNPTPVYQALDKRAKIPSEKFAALLQESGLSSEDISFLDDFMSSKDLEELKSFCQTENALAAFNELKNILETLWELGLANCAKLDLSVVRGLAYYTGLIFEVFDKSKSMRAIAGGGRYDDLCSKLGGPKQTGVGFGMGDVVIADLLQSKNLLPNLQKDRIDYFITSFTDPGIMHFVVAEKLRACGYRVSHPLQFQKFKKQMDAANHCGARKVLFLDSEQAPEGQYEIKDLKSGKQSFASIEDLD